VGRTLHHIGMPLWTSALPAATHVNITQTHLPRKVVYFPSCINQTMGATPEKSSSVKPVIQEMVELCNKAGYEVLFPENMRNLC
jgi:D-lactate dehydrogenase